MQRPPDQATAKKPGASTYLKRHKPARLASAWSSEFITSRNNWRSSEGFARSARCPTFKSRLDKCRPLSCLSVTARIQARAEGYGCRDAGGAHGFQPESFAYPFSDFDSGLETQVIQHCGDNSGRLSSGVKDKTVFAETIPPADPFATRTPADPRQGTTVATIGGYVTAAEQNGGGWVQLTFHHICGNCDAYSITAANMRALLDWLETQVTAGTVVVESTREVIGGTYVTPFCC